MASSGSNNTLIFSSDTKASFLNHVHDTPNNRRVSSTDKEVIIEWLTNPSKRPSSQKEFSRRNYVRKTFVWDEDRGSLLACGKDAEENLRTVITEDAIVDVVESVHQLNSHLGWDATWKDVSSLYYGILRSDVIFLLKQCQVCALDPTKRPKGRPASKPNSQSSNRQIPQASTACNLKYNNETWEPVNNDGASCSLTVDCFTGQELIEDSKEDMHSQHFSQR